VHCSQHDAHHLQAHKAVAGQGMFRGHTCINFVPQAPTVLV
jgi:hypothetical protein